MPKYKQIGTGAFFGDFRVMSSARIEHIIVVVRSERISQVMKANMVSKEMREKTFDRIRN
jgi:hypothetical protein